MSAPCSMSAFAVSKCMFISARTSGVVPCRVFEVDVRLALDELADALDATFSCRVEQRREAATIHVFGAAFRGDLAVPVSDDAARVDVGAFGDEQLDHRGMALSRGPHESGLLAP